MSFCFYQDLADEMQSEDPGRIFLDTDLLGRAVFERIRMTSDQLVSFSYKNFIDSNFFTLFIKTQITFLADFDFFHLTKSDKIIIKFSELQANQPEEEANKAVFYLASTYER